MLTIGHIKFHLYYLRNVREISNWKTQLVITRTSHFCLFVMSQLFIKRSNFQIVNHNYYMNKLFLYVCDVTTFYQKVKFLCLSLLSVQKIEFRIKYKCFFKKNIKNIFLVLKHVMIRHYKQQKFDLKPWNNRNQGK
jgi:hypothetical protein